MEFLFNKLSTLFIEFIGYVSSKLSARKRTSFGRRLGRILILLDRKRFAITKDNLSKAFPEKDADWVTRIARLSYENLGTTFVELFTFPYFTEEDFRYYVSYENIDVIARAKARGNGVILLSGHYGNWEMLAYTAGLFTGDGAQIIVRDQKNSVLDKLINIYRTQGNNTIVPMHRAALSVAKTLKNGGTVAMLVDQSASSKDLFVEFFGRHAATYRTPAELALRFGAPIVTGYASRNDEGTYEVRLTEIDFSDLEFSREGIEELTRRHVNQLENIIRQRPELWSWQHKRWKYTPPDEIPYHAKTED